MPFAGRLLHLFQPLLGLLGLPDHLQEQDPLGGIVSAPVGRLQILGEKMCLVARLRHVFFMRGHGILPSLPQNIYSMSGSDRNLGSAVLLG